MCSQCKQFFVVLWFLLLWGVFINGHRVTSHGKGVCCGCSFRQKLIELTAGDRLFRSTLLWKKYSSQCNHLTQMLKYMYIPLCKYRLEFFNIYTSYKNITCVKNYYWNETNKTYWFLEPSSHLIKVLVSRILFKTNTKPF